MLGRGVVRDWLIAGLVLCGIGLERLLNAHLVGRAAVDFAPRVAIGGLCAGIGLVLILGWARDRWATRGGGPFGPSRRDRGTISRQ